MDRPCWAMVVTASFISSGADNTTIGGNGLGNVIMGSRYAGIEIDGASTGTVIYGNYIGINVAGTKVSGSGENGILLENGAASTTIGGTGTGLANVITGNGWNTQFTAGVYVSSTAGTGNSIIANSIYDNAGIGIDLGAQGVTANDSLDSDTGANNLTEHAGAIYCDHQWHDSHRQRLAEHSRQHGRYPHSLLRDACCR